MPHNNTRFAEQQRALITSFVTSTIGSIAYTPSPNMVSWEHLGNNGLSVLICVG